MLSKNRTTFPTKVQGHASSSLFPFSIALALFIGTATFRVPADRTASLEATIGAMQEEINRLTETPEAIEAQRRAIVTEQLAQGDAVPMCWLWGIFEGACNSRVPPPAGFLESIENFTDNGYTSSAQYSYTREAIVTNPLTNILTNAPQDTNPRITEFMAEYNGRLGIPAWRAMVLGVNSNGEIIMEDFRALQGMMMNHDDDPYQDPSYQESQVQEDFGWDDV